LAAIKGKEWGSTALLIYQSGVTGLLGRCAELACQTFGLAATTGREKTPHKNEESGEG
jgi:hypothetical protein